MAQMSKNAAALFSEVHDAVLAEVERIGPARFRRDAVVKAFLGRGASRRTLYRWCADILASPDPVRHLQEKVAQAVAERARSPDPAADMARDVARLLPPSPVDAVAAVLSMREGGSLDFMDLLRRCLEDAELIRAYARAPDGSVRSAKLVLAASQHLRQIIETAARIQKTITELAHMNRFHKELLDAIKDESPACAERIVQRLQQICNVWAPPQHAAS